MLNAQEIASGLVNAEYHEWQPSEYHYNGKLGVMSPKHVWFWFNFYADGTLIFDHAYSQINGSTKRDWRARERAEFLLMRLAGIKPTFSLRKIN
jgi:hypothetical protein